MALLGSFQGPSSSPNFGSSVFWKASFWYRTTICGLVGLAPLQLLPSYDCDSSSLWCRALPWRDAAAGKRSQPTPARQTGWLVLAVQRPALPRAGEVQQVGNSIRMCIASPGRAALSSSPADSASVPRVSWQEWTSRKRDWQSRLCDLSRSDA